VWPSRRGVVALRCDQAIVLLGLAGLAAISWTGTVLFVRGMLPAHSGMAGGHAGAGEGGQVAPLFLMWTVMMAAMMIPVAAPSLLAVAAGNRENRERRDPVARATLFLSGDLLVWTVFSLLAAFAQWRLHEAALLTPAMASSSAAFSGALLVAIGLFQFTPMKRACLRRCRALPASAADGFRERPRSVFRLGLEHGVFSAGSCGALMLVLFATGVMSLLGMALLTGLLVAERIAPRGLWVSRTSGALFAAWGGWMLLTSLS
jgi:predicted metal-binding membrane protein